MHPGLGMCQEQPPAPGRGSPAPWGELAPKGPPRGDILVTLMESGRAGVLWLLCSGTSRSLLSTAGQTPAPRNKPFQGSQPGHEQGAGLQGWGRLPKGKSSPLSIHIELPSFLNLLSAAPNSFVLPLDSKEITLPWLPPQHLQGHLSAVIKCPQQFCRSVRHNQPVPHSLNASESILGLNKWFWFLLQEA